MTSKANPFEKHNHSRCKSSALKSAEKLCQQRHIRFTDIRREVLELVWASHQPVTAYDILRQLRQHKPNAEPPTVYRALDFLLENELIHRIESLNAFIGCDHIGDSHECHFLICSKCNQSIEINSSERVNQEIEKTAKKLNFNIHRQIIEIQGVCQKCQ